MMHPTQAETQNNVESPPRAWAVRTLPNGAKVLRRKALARLCDEGWHLSAIGFLLFGLTIVTLMRQPGTAEERSVLLALFWTVAFVGAVLRVWMTQAEVIAGPRRIAVWRGWPRMRCAYDAEGDHTELRIGTTWSVVSDEGAPQQQVERELSVVQVGNGFERIVGLTRHTAPDRWLAEGAAAGDEAALLGLYLSRVTGWRLTGLPPHGAGTGV